MQPAALLAPSAATHGCFVLHTSRVEGSGQGGLRLILENLRTGEKHRFGSPEALGQYLKEWGTGPDR